MASRLIGRTDCPECGHGAAHVKVAEGEGKRPYRYCPECGAQYFPRSDRQARDLEARTRPEKHAAPAAVDERSTAPTPPPPPPQPKRRGLFA
jgi:predicted  nucleic acid-binding Zn-ribbon protein